MDFEWDPAKNEENIEKHHVSFKDARRVWLDPDRVTASDPRHGMSGERRYFLYGKVSGDVLTVRFIRRGQPGNPDRRSGLLARGIG